jgi:hypothetical protein
VEGTDKKFRDKRVWLTARTSSKAVPGEWKSLDTSRNDADLSSLGPLSKAKPKHGVFWWLKLVKLGGGNMGGKLAKDFQAVVDGFETN